MYIFLKRILDFLLSGLALVILSPLLFILSLLVKIKLGSPVIFCQDRPGKISRRDGKEKVFKLYKFRTMTNAKNSEGEFLPDEERLTKFGKKLRSTSLDELPELWNIMKGDMSIVGPRPLLVRYLPLYSEEQHHRHDVRPGLTGYAQAYGRNSLTWTEKFKLDLYYVHNISFGLDVKVFFKTIVTVLRREGISASRFVTMEEFKGEKE